MRAFSTAEVKDAMAKQKYMEKYLRTMNGVTGEARMKIFHLIRDISADRADLLAGWIGRVEEAVGRDGTRHVEIRDSRLDDDALTREVDLEDAVHARE